MKKMNLELKDPLYSSGKQREIRALQRASWGIVDRLLSQSGERASWNGTGTLGGKDYYIETIWFMRFLAKSSIFFKVARIFSVKLYTPSKFYFKGVFGITENIFQENILLENK